MKAIKLLAIILVYLMISLIFVWPINAQITNIEINGADNIENYRSSRDVTNIKITSTDPVKIKTNTEGYIDLDCQGTLGDYLCTHQFPSSERASGEYKYLFSDNQSRPDVIKTFIVDGMEPTINSYTIENDGTAFIFKYDLTDTASTSGLDGVGIKKISLVANSDTIFEKTFEEIKKSQVGEERIENANIVGDVTFYLTVEDALGNYIQDSSLTGYYDLKAPVIENILNVKQLDKDVTMISTSTETSMIVDFSFYIIEDNLDKVYVDATDVSSDPRNAGVPGQPQLGLYYNRTPTCVDEGGIKYKCTLKALTLNPGKGDITLKVFASDTYGNTVEKDLTKQFALSNQQGTITYMGPNSSTNCFGPSSDTDCYVKEGLNEFFLDINKGDAEIDASLITLNVGELSSSNYIRPINCELGDDDVYKCTAFLYVNEGSTGTIGKIMLGRPSVDRVGAPLIGIAESVVHRDFDKPELLNDEINFSQKMGNSVVPEACPVSGETATFSVLVSDAISPTLKMIVHTGEISSTETFENNCEPTTNNQFLCSVNINNFVTYYAKEEVKIDIIDLAGNKLELNKEVEICEADRNAVPELIKKVTVTKEPYVDLHIASIIPFKIFLPFKVTPRNSNVKILSVEHDGCRGTDYLGSGETYFYGQEKISTTKKATLVTTIGGYASEYEEDDEIPINCTVKLYLRDKYTRYLQPEPESLITKLDTVDAPFGTISANNEKELSKIKNEIKSLHDDISDDEDIDYWLSMICNWGKVISVLRGIVTSIKTTIAVVAWILEIAPGEGDVVWAAVCNPLSMIETGLGYLWPVNVPLLGNSLKLFCLWHSCAQCTVSGTLNMGLTTFDLGMEGYGMYQRHSIDDRVEENNADKNKNEKELADVEKKLKNKEDLTDEERKKLEHQEAQLKKEQAEIATKTKELQIEQGVYKRETLIEEKEKLEKEIEEDREKLKDLQEQTGEGGLTKQEQEALQKEIDKLNKEIKNKNTNLDNKKTEIKTHDENAEKNKNELEKLEELEENAAEAAEKAEESLERQQDITEQVNNIKDGDMSDLRKLDVHTTDGTMWIDDDTGNMFNIKNDGSILVIHGNDLKLQTSTSFDSDYMSPNQREQALEDFDKTLDEKIKNVILTEDERKKEYDEMVDILAKLPQPKLSTSVSDNLATKAESVTKEEIKNYENLFTIKVSDVSSSYIKSEQQSIFYVQSLYNDDTTTGDVTAPLTAYAASDYTSSGSIGSKAAGILGGMSNAGSMVDPYRSAKVADACFCWPAQIYNNKKKLQLKCKLYKCLEENMEKGTPTNACYDSYSTGYCLYYDGAYARMNSINTWFEVLGENLPYELASLISIDNVVAVGCWYAEATGANLKTCKLVDTSAANILCSTWTAVTFIRDFTATINSFSSTIVDFTGIQTEDQYCEGLI